MREEGGGGTKGEVGREEGRVGEEKERGEGGGGNVEGKEEERVGEVEVLRGEGMGRGGERRVGEVLGCGFVLGFLCCCGGVEEARGGGIDKKEGV